MLRLLPPVRQRHVRRSHGLNIPGQHESRPPLWGPVGRDHGGFYSGTRFGPNATVSYRHSQKLSASVRAGYFDIRFD